MKILSNKKLGLLLRRAYSKGYINCLRDQNETDLDLIKQRFLESKTPEEFCDFFYEMWVKDMENENE